MKHIRIRIFQRKGDTFDAAALCVRSLSICSHDSLEHVLDGSVEVPHNFHEICQLDVVVASLDFAEVTKANRSFMAIRKSPEKSDLEQHQPC